LSYQDEQLNQLMREALAGSPDLAIAQARVQRARATAEVAGAPLLPQISAMGAVTSQRLSYNYLTPEANVTRDWNQFGQAALSITWEIDFWGKYRSGLAAATSELEARLADQAQAALVRREQMRYHTQRQEAVAGARQRVFEQRHDSNINSLVAQRARYTQAVAVQNVSYLKNQATFRSAHSRTNQMCEQMNPLSAD
jgi:hypothetical protein